MQDEDVDNDSVKNMSDMSNIRDENSDLNNAKEALQQVENSNLTEQEKNIKNEGMNDDILKRLSNLEELSNRFRTTLENLKSSLSDQLGIDHETITSDLNTRSPSELSSQMLKYIAERADPVLDGLVKIQDSVGETGRSLEKSPKTVKTIMSKIKEIFLGNEQTSNFEKYSHGLTVLLVITSLSVGITGAIKNHNIINTTNNLANAPNYPQGCVQYNTKTGIFRVLGFCGGANNKECNSLSDGSWCTKDVTGNIIDIRQQINTSNTCSKTCVVDNDCNVKPNNSLSNPCPDNFNISSDGTMCNPPSDFSFKCKDGACSPNPVYSTNFNIVDQVNWGTSSFCYTDGYSNYPCPIVADNYCIACSTNSQYACVNAECEKGNLVQSSSCVCQGEDWNTQPVCITTLDVIHVLSLMNKNIDIWSVPKTPITVYLITGLGILLLIVTFIWYIKYLITQGKK